RKQCVIRAARRTVENTPDVRLETAHLAREDEPIDHPLRFFTFGGHRRYTLEVHGHLHMSASFWKHGGIGGGLFFPRNQFWWFLNPHNSRTLALLTSHRDGGSLSLLAPSRL